MTLSVDAVVGCGHSVVVPKGDSVFVLSNCAQSPPLLFVAAGVPHGSAAGACFGASIKERNQFYR